MRFRLYTVALVAVVILVGVSTVTPALGVPGPRAAGSQEGGSDTPYSRCERGLEVVGTLKSAATHLVNRNLFPPPINVHDQFTGLDSRAWRWVNFTDSCITVDRGLSLTVPRDALSWMYAASELQSQAAYPAWIGPHQPTTSFTARLRGADLTGVWGTRGWGYFHTALVNADTDYALFMYGNGPSGVSSSLPPGFYAMTAAAGGTPTAVRLDESLLAADHDYTVTWAHDQVQFLIDGTVVATNTSSVPRNRLTVSLWADNATYNYVPTLTHPLLLIPGFLPSPKDNTLQATSVTLH